MAVVVVVANDEPVLTDQKLPDFDVQHTTSPPPFDFIIITLCKL